MPSNVLSLQFTPQANFSAHNLEFHWKWRYGIETRLAFKYFLFQKFHDKVRHCRFYKILYSKATIECDKCKDTFKSNNLLKDHMKRSHNPTKPFECSKCFKRFLSKENLEKHFARYHELRNVKICPYCQKQFSRLEAHLPQCPVKNPNRKPKQCSYCGKTYISEVNHKANHCITSKKKQKKKSWKRT